MSLLMLELLRFSFWANVYLLRVPTCLSFLHLPMPVSGMQTYVSGNISTTCLCIYLGTCLLINLDISWLIYSSLLLSLCLFVYLCLSFLCVPMPLSGMQTYVSGNISTTCLSIYLGTCLLIYLDISWLIYSLLLLSLCLFVYLSTRVYWII